MLLYHFSETPYPDIPDEQRGKSMRVEIPSGLYDPVKGGRNYHQRLDEWCLADELGLNIMLNEHHASATCTVSSIAVFAGILARQTKKARILELGNPTANRLDPVRVAEETAMVDVLSGGRLDVGFVRGVPFEIAASNTTPIGMRERMWEAHDLIIKAWTTTDGPFNWEGKYFHHRQVNVWPRPIQQPHPPIWLPTSSPGGAADAARHGHVCAAFTTGFETTRKIFDAYRAAWRETHGTEAPDDRLAFLGFCNVADTDEQGYENAKGLMWYLSHNTVSPQFRNPPGYVTPETVVTIVRGGGIGAIRQPDVDVQLEVGNLFAGTPVTVVKQIKKFYDEVGGVGHMMLMGHAGHMTNDQTSAHLKLMANEVYPQIQDLGAAAPAAA